VTLSHTPDPGNENEAKPPLRDWLLLSLLGVLTIVFLAGSTELIARRMFVSSSSDKEGCMIENDPSTGWRGRPNCTNIEKMYESAYTEIRFNSSGFRNNFDFAPKQPGTYRIVLLGSSAVQGGGVKEEDTIASLLPAQLSAKTGRRVEIYNEAIEGWGGTPRNIASRFSKALSVQPDLVLWILTLWDVRNSAGMSPHDELLLPDETRLYPDKPASPSGATAAPPRAAGIPAWPVRMINSARKAAADAWHGSRSRIMLSHFQVEYESQRQFVESQDLGHQDTEYLSAQPNEKRLKHLRELDSYVAEIQRQASAAGVPVVAVYWPSATQAAVICLGGWPGADPWSFDNELRAVFENRGVTYVDILPDYRNVPDPQSDYFPYDGHPNAKGDAAVSAMLARGLTSGAVPALRATAHP
jgi:hypothetical protein